MENILPQAIALLKSNFTDFRESYLVDRLDLIWARMVSHWLLPETANQAVNGSDECVPPAVAAIVAAHTAIVLVDDLLDDDARFAPLGLAPGDQANLAVGLFAAGQLAIARCAAQPDARRLAMEEFQRMMLATTCGQDLDAHLTQAPDESTYWRLASAKSAPFFGAALAMGGILGGAGTASVDTLRALGRIYGEMVQLHDDLKDVFHTPASPDWSTGRACLPVLFARSVAHPEQARFIELCANVQDAQALHAAQSILLRCGAVSYCVQHLLQRYTLAMKYLDTANLANRAPLDALFQEIQAPIDSLFAKAGVPAMAYA